MVHSGDAFVAAGMRRCVRCDRIVYPIDATWLDDETVLATFEMTCGHGPDHTMILDAHRTGRLDPETAELFAAGRRCAGTTRAGKPCRANAQAGHTMCSNHRDQEVEHAE